MRSTTHPGTPEHQELLRAIADYYAGDDRVAAVAVFGSLGRGTWDSYSDIDLDVVIDEGVTLDAVSEARRLCGALGQQPAVIIPDRDDAADVVLTSLMQLSVRYHPLHTTSPNIVDDLVVLTGRIDRAAIVAAGRANRRADQPRPQDLVGACIRLAVTTDAQLHRREFWVAYLVLHLAREQILRLFTTSHGALRPYHGFEAAGQTIKARLGKTLAGDSLRSIQQALLRLLDILEQDLKELSADQVRLTSAQHNVLAQLRTRQASLNLNAS